MTQSEETGRLFQSVVDGTPQEIRLQVAWSYDIADRIAQRLQQLGWSQKEFAVRMKTSEAAVSKWVGGGHNFTLATLAKISSALGINLISCP
jgi:ribosome-binding protein aMBF1 (putative translation factor)